MIYCIEAWGNATNGHLEQLYLIQKKVTKMISFSNSKTHCIDIFKQLNILPLNKVVVNRIGLMMYKHANKILPPAINDLYIENCEVHNYPTRQKHLLPINKNHINIYSKSLVNTCARIWNAMHFFPLCLSLDVCIICLLFLAYHVNICIVVLSIYHNATFQQ